MIEKVKIVSQVFGTKTAGMPRKTEKRTCECDSFHI